MLLGIHIFHHTLAILICLIFVAILVVMDGSMVTMELQLGLKLKEHLWRKARGLPMSWTRIAVQSILNHLVNMKKDWASINHTSKRPGTISMQLGAKKVVEEADKDIDNEQLCVTDEKDLISCHNPGSKQLQTWRMDAYEKTPCKAY
ncbi:uncharacterized protein LOC100844876 isoform X3 [Brachypodium distachyon]|uniref:uncharacterized protein LOC100844876 isoform X3 n=1 Tax=Brachypodium distachyon TaxID=15368 RepID=UPI000D0DA343|nr:uncharacterized protein LOC100844876 isoform X3 [Brachypodium distachyon]|eukprot:XP_024314215.1 uncharacterized protein LOC100844876 isoform X3 [Brachypodium distachyon]